MGILHSVQNYKDRGLLLLLLLALVAVGFNYTLGETFTTWFVFVGILCINLYSNYFRDTLKGYVWSGWNNLRARYNVVDTGSVAVGLLCINISYIFSSGWYLLGLVLGLLFIIVVPLLWIKPYFQDQGAWNKEDQQITNY